MSAKLKQDLWVGKNLQKHRLQAGLSQEAVAAKLQVQGHDISREILSQMERGKYSIRVSVLLALAALYGQPIHAFFEDMEPNLPLDLSK